MSKEKVNVLDEYWLDQVVLCFINQTALIPSTKDNCLNSRCLIICIEICYMGDLWPLLSSSRLQGRTCVFCSAGIWWTHGQGYVKGEWLSVSHSQSQCLLFFYIWDSNCVLMSKLFPNFEGNVCCFRHSTMRLPNWTH